ncbi:lactate utilization protein [Notoacmeibacter sp. MSK16QG-6]|uniref:LutC/YkgG family protein n=1 Tax=Notoacmeibacter sp. MSK16QG-6 TaxID=2957982 RepID=UPI00209FE591|nr:lactate utilization protein [Notoacmeibacter sp. MSK16QG-6]MCP1198532.1 lactate utilization protein [Notoacmeibacter sp. MSK16QG-6]
MSSARKTILERIGKAMDEGLVPTLSERQQGANARLSEKKPALVPASANVFGEEAIALFSAKAEAVNATVVRISSSAEIASAVTDYLATKNLPAKIRRGADPLLDQAGWESEPLLDVSIGPSDGSDIAGLSVAASAVAETGTLTLCSGPENPTTLNFLPDYHLIVLPVDRLHGSLEKSLRRLVDEATVEDRALPRVVNLVTGPSRSGDVEQQIVLGAHGPRALHIILLG